MQAAGLCGASPHPGPGGHSGQQDPVPRGLCPVRTTENGRVTSPSPTTDVPPHRDGQALAPSGRARRARGTLQASLGDAHTRLLTTRLLGAHSRPPGRTTSVPQQRDPVLGRVPGAPSHGLPGPREPPESPPPPWRAQRPGDPAGRPTAAPRRPRPSLRAPPHSTSRSRAPAARPRPRASRASCPLPWLRPRCPASGPHSLVFSRRPSDARPCRLHELPPRPRLPQLGNPEAPSQPRT